MVPRRQTAGENKVNFSLIFSLVAPEQTRAGAVWRIWRTAPSLAVIGSHDVPDPADFLCGYAALCSGRHRLGLVPADPVRRSGPVGNGLGVFARGLELPGGAGEERGRARSVLIRPNASLEAFSTIDGQHLAKNMARAVAAQKHDGVGDVVAIGDAAGGNARQHRLLVQASGL